MKRIPVLFDGLEEIIRFVDIINKFEYECDLCCGRYYVDAKSLLGAITLHDSSNIELIIHDDKADKLLQKIKHYCGQ